jgi:hypothetical protein
MTQSEGLAMTEKRWGRFFASLRMTAVKDSLRMIKREGLRMTDER